MSDSRFVIRPYRGRFAPSPTGSLHLGSLYTALASFLQAKAQKGLWLLRIDDLDAPRTVAGASDAILNTLERFELHWDESVYYQSQHQALYEDYLQALIQQQAVYPCSCSRKTLANFQQSQSVAIYPGFCRNRTTVSSESYAWRLKTPAVSVEFVDGLQGFVHQALAEQQGDFILKRRDQIIAYPFAVVIDDQHQQITEVVRGFDLLNCTPAQIYLHQRLGFQPPNYSHLPIVTDQQGYKLSKQTLAPAVDVRQPSDTLFYLLSLLKQQPPLELFHAPVAELLQWAIAHWQIHALKNVSTCLLSAPEYAPLILKNS